MTIAACYLSPEGIVFGADSTSTYTLGMPPFGFGREKHYNFGQKLFEIGEQKTFAVVTWGLGSLSVGSYRTLIALLADSLENNPPANVLDVAVRWVDQFWSAYTTSLSTEIAQLTQIAAKQPPNPQLPLGDANTRNLAEEFFLRQNKERLVVGFCLGGYVRQDRKPEAYQIIFDPLHGKPAPEAVPPAQSFWGVPALITRLINGCADEVIGAILGSGKWKGTQAELEALIRVHKLMHPTTVPIREAID